MNWKKSINVKQFLGEDATPEAAVKTAKNVKQYLSKNLPEYPNLKDFETIKQEPKKWQVTALNNALDKLYDYGDANRVWMGL